MIKITAEQTKDYTFLHFPLFDNKGWIEIQIETSTGRFCNLCFRTNLGGSPATISMDAPETPKSTHKQKRHSQDGSILVGE